MTRYQHSHGSDVVTSFLMEYDDGDDDDDDDDDDDEMDSRCVSIFHI